MFDLERIKSAVDSKTYRMPKNMSKQQFKDWMRKNRTIGIGSSGCGHATVNRDAVGLSPTIPAKMNGY